MAREKSQILQLQSQYLQTQQPQYLEELYKKLIDLGLFVQRASPEVNQEIDSVYDVATSICLRLMTKGEPVLRSPSAYLKSALFYLNKQSFVDSLDAHDFEAPTDSPDYSEFVTDLVETHNIDTKTELGELVAKTLESRISADKVARHLDPSTAQEYTNQMKEVRSRVEESVQSTRLYPPR